MTALAVFCAATLWLQAHHIDSTLPYPLDIDEGFVSGPASRMVVTGTLHPNTFNYPSLPKYLAAIGMSVGFLRGAAHHEVREVQKIGSVGFPYYETPRVMRTARLLFALLSVVALAATGLAAWEAFQRPSTILLAPVALSMSPLFFSHSWMYLNVDVVGLCCTSLAMAAVLLGMRRPSLIQSAILPGALAGLATGSKYTLALVIVPALGAIVASYGRGDRLWRGLAALVSMVAAFVAVVPYSLLDIPMFLNGVGAEVYHYAGGHAGWEAEPGLGQLLYYVKTLVSDFTVPGAAAALAGVWAYGRIDWRRTAVLLAFPAALLALLASQHVHFPRNILSLEPIVAMFVAFGIVTVRAWAVGLGARKAWNTRYRAGIPLAAGALVLLAAIPWWRIADHVRDRTDSRNAAAAWIERRIPQGWTIIVPNQLCFDTRPLKARGARVADVDLQTASDPAGFNRLFLSVQQPAVILLPRWGADSRFAGQATADQLNALANSMKILQTFGSNPVLVNYAQPAPWGDPEFAIAAMGQHAVMP